uniref:Patatin-like protein 3 n=1 Tax=Elaeis guineensis var. tenera TaxID=51953 RepID=A0A6I9QB28_ELAGV|nr:patatin-like protein 3 [Elaeis guineensis]
MEIILLVADDQGTKHVGASKQLLKDPHRYLLNIGEKVEEKIRTLILLSSLPSSFESLMAALLVGKSTIKIEEVTSVLLQNEILRQENRVSSSDSDSTLTRLPSIQGSNDGTMVAANNDTEIVDVLMVSDEISTPSQQEELFESLENSEGTIYLSDGLSCAIKDIRMVSVETHDGAVRKLDEQAWCFLTSFINLYTPSDDPTIWIVDFFSLAARSGTGSILAAMLFTRGPDGHPLFSTDNALRLLIKNHSRLTIYSEKKILHKIFQRSDSGSCQTFFQRILDDTALQDMVKLVLIPCYDLAFEAPFVFSQVDVVETDGYDFLMQEVCAATCTTTMVVEMQSMDSRMRIRAVGGSLIMRNPTAVAVMHMLNNKQEFPFTIRVENLLVVYLHPGELEITEKSSMPPSVTEFIRIPGMGQANIVDQVVAMAFGKNRAANLKF